MFVAIISITGVLLLPLFFSSTENRVRQESISNVEAAGAAILQSIGYDIRHASSVTYPLAGATSGSLILQTLASSTNPTRFFLESGSLIALHGVERTVLNPPDVKVVDFQARNTSGTPTSQSILISFTLSRTTRITKEVTYQQKFEALNNLYPKGALASSVSSIFSSAPASSAMSSIPMSSSAASSAPASSSVPISSAASSSAAASSAPASSSAGSSVGPASSTASSTATSSSVPACGNGNVQPLLGEQCDDGGTIGGNGCSSTCMMENNCSCWGEPSMCQCGGSFSGNPTPSCGNGNVQPSQSEQCDDGNTVNGDGCNNVCIVENNCSCIGTPSSCYCNYPSSSSSSPVSSSAASTASSFGGPIIE